MLPFTEEFRLFRERTEPKHFQGLIIVGTGQNTTAALLIGTLKVDHIAFLLSNETKAMPDKVAEMLGRSSAGWLRIPLSDTSTLAIYDGVKTVIEQWQHLERGRIALDMTGGLKPMTVGLAKAGHLLGLQTLYVESDYSKSSEGKSVLQAGTQRLVIPPNPYKVFGDLEAEEAKRLYGDHDYNGAQSIFAKLAQEVPETQRYQLYADLSEAYDAWEVLNFDKAVEKLAAVVENINHDPSLHAYIHQLQEQLNSAKELATITSTVGSDDRNSKLSVLADKNKILHLLSTLRSIAKRRASDGRYDVAALYQYRAIELISQHRLATYKCLASEIDYSQIIDPQSGQQIAENDLKNRYINKHRLVINARRRRQPNDRTQLATRLPGKKPGLFASYNLLAALDDPFLQNYNWADIEVRTETRNNSILAHGYRLITQNEFESFAQVAEELYSRLLELHGEDQQVWEVRSQFIQPF